MPELSTSNLVVLSATAIAIIAMLKDPSQGMEIAKTIGIGLVGFLGNEAIHRKEYKGGIPKD